MVDDKIFYYQYLTYLITKIFTFTQFTFYFNFNILNSSIFTSKKYKGTKNFISISK